MRPNTERASGRPPMTALRVMMLSALVLAAAACSSGSSKATPATTTPVSATSSSTTNPTPPAASLPITTVLKNAEENANRAGWVHIDARFDMSGMTLVFSQDSGPDAGRQTVTIGSDRATVIVIGRVAYVNATAGALQDYAGLPASSASLAGKWISFHPSDAQYGTVASGVTLHDALQQISLGPPLERAAPTMFDGQRVIGINGNVPTSAGSIEPGTLYVTASGTTLPVGFDFSDPGGTDRVVFSAWGNAVKLRPPANPIDISTVVSGSV